MPRAEAHNQGAFTRLLSCRPPTDRAAAHQAPPDPRHRRVRQPRLHRHRPRRPVRGVLRLALPCPLHHRGDLLVTHRPRTARTRQVTQPCHALTHRTRPPLADRALLRPDLTRHLPMGDARSASQDDPAAQSRRVRRRSAPDQILKPFTLLSSQYQFGLGPSRPSRASAPLLNRNHDSEDQVCVRAGTLRPNGRHSCGPCEAGRRRPVWKPASPAGPDGTGNQPQTVLSVPSVPGSAARRHERSQAGITFWLRSVSKRAAKEVRVST